tara:strand:- start:221 stop:1396 length:1176 start_codon:yes stop_codon:yes gene_type:complete
VVFQTLDDKSECVGIYVDGSLHFDKIPTGLTKTWKYTGSVQGPDIEYAWLYAAGASLEQSCPDTLKEDWNRCHKRFVAYRRAFELGKINLREHCFFDLVPESFLEDFCDVKNKITEYIFETRDRPENYKLLSGFQKLIYKIGQQSLNLNKDECRQLYHTTSGRHKANELLKGAHHIDYNLFGTVTGRLTTRRNSFPILTLKKEFRKLVKPHNDWLVSLDYNGAEVRTLLQLTGHEQPNVDIHDWNVKHLFNNDVDRATAKTLFFSWLYNPESDAIQTKYYDRKKVLDKWYDGEYIKTPYNRKIKVDERRALNYLIQSTTSDRVLSRAVEINRLLEGKKSFISHIVHDEVVIDLCDEERELLAEVRDIFETDEFRTNVQAGKNYLELEELKV